MDPDKSAIITRPSTLRVPENFPPELRLVLGLLRTALRTDTGTEIPALCHGVDWAVFGACVERHRVGAFLHHRLPAEIRSALPGEAAQQLLEQSQLNMRRALTQAAELVRLVAVLEAAAIPVISLKGPLLARELYGDLGLRHAGDVDLLVTPENAGRADGLLRGAGYRRVSPDFELTPRQEKRYLRLRHDFSYLADPPRPRMEMMWRLEQIPNPDDVWRRAMKQELGGREIRTLPRDMNAYYLFQHGARHGWFRLFWLLDVALLLAGGGMDWDDLAARARNAQVERPLLQGARLAGELLGVPVPPAFLPLPCERQKTALFAEKATRWMAVDDGYVKTTAGFFRQIIYRIRMQQGWRAKYSIIRERLTFVRAWKMLRLPDSCFVLYYPAMPFLCAYSCIFRDRKSSR